MATVAEPASLPRSSPGWRARAFHWSARSLVAATWLSGAIFGAYILAFFGGLALRGSADRWNESLPQLHDAANPLSTVAIGLHFAAGGVLLLLGPVQLIGGIRRRHPALHRGLGRLYLLCAGLAGIGGLCFILAKGTVGGPVMSTGFAIYGAAMATTSILAYAAARARHYERHRAWAIRLFALTVGSWLYRMEYGFWFLAADGAGHQTDFRGWFDAVMAFFFYLPNLAVAELFIRGRREQLGSRAQASALVAMVMACAFVLLATWTFTTDFWGPGIVRGITGAS